MGSFAPDPFESFQVGQQVGASKYAGLGEFAKNLTERAKALDLLHAKTQYDVQGEVAKEKALSPFRVEEAGLKAKAETQGKLEGDPMAQYLMGGLDGGGMPSMGGGDQPPTPPGGGNDLLLDAVRRERARRQSAQVESSDGLAYAEEVSPEQETQSVPFGRQSQAGSPQVPFSDRLSRIRQMLPPGSSYDVGGLRIAGAKEQTPQQAAFAEQFQQGLNSINKVEQIIQEGGSGKLVQAGLPFSPGARVLEFHLKNAADILLRLRSGAQINEKEFNRLRGLLPLGRDVIFGLGEDVVGEKIRTFQDAMSSVIRRQQSRGWSPVEEEEPDSF